YPTTATFCWIRASSITRHSTASENDDSTSGGLGRSLMNRARRLGKVGALAAIALLGAGSRASAMFLDEARLFKLTGGFYTQTRVRMQDSDGPEDLDGGGTQPKVQIGQLIQWRNYAFPVLEGDLARF